MYKRQVYFPLFVVHFLHQPHPPGDGDLLPGGRRLHDGAQFLRTGPHRVLHVFLEHRIELVVVDDALPGQAYDQAAVLGLADVVDADQVAQQSTRCV